MMRKSDRSAAMQLGVSTIVILVIAMVIIGSGISFIRTFFSQGQEHLLKTFPASDVGLNPTNTNPLVLGSNELRVTQGETSTIQAAIYNTEPDSVTYELNISNCINRSGADSTAISLTSPSTEISASESTAFQGILSTEGATPQASPYICNVQAIRSPSGSGPGESVHSKQVTVQVTS
jgi:hypothetical protein